jgi:DNA gyrase subunit A
MKVSDLRVQGRATQGVRLITLGKGDEISSVEKIEKMEEEAEGNSHLTENHTPIAESNTVEQNPND